MHLKEIEKLISHGKIEKAISLILDVIKSNLGDYTQSESYNDILLCSSQFYEYKTSKNRGIKNSEEIKIEYAQINNRVIEILLNVEKELKSKQISNNNKIRILFIDDDKATNYYNKLILDKYEHQELEFAGSTANPYEAVKLIYEKRPDVVLLDINMPHLSGWDILNCFEDLFFYLIILSTSSKTKEIERAMQYSGVDYMVKPLTEKKLDRIFAKMKNSIAENHLKYRIFKDSIEKKDFKIALKSSQGILPVKLEDIEIIADKNYQVFLHLKDHDLVQLQYDMNHYKDLLDDEMFIHVNNNLIINSLLIEELDGVNYYLKMKSKKEITLSKVEHDLVYSKMEKVNQVTTTVPPLEKNNPQRTLKSKFDSHFIKNGLNTILYLVKLNDTQKAISYIENFKNLFDLTSNDNYFLEHSLNDEIKFTKSYLELEKIRFLDNLSYKFLIDEDIDRKQLIPIMSIHTFVNNSIKHGRIEKTQEINILIQIEKNGDLLNIQVIDNGSGDESNAFKRTGGLKIITETIEFLNMKYINNYKFEIQNILDREKRITGTKVNLILPIK